MVDHRSVVAWVDPGAAYPDDSPFHPEEAYPEYRFSEVAAGKNAVYRMIRNCFHLAGLDADNFGTPRWNPLRGLVEPGETVLLKPNLVKECHPRDPDGWRYVITHGSVIRAVADYVWLALDGRGKVVVADAPQTDSSFEAIVHLLGLRALERFYRSHGLDFQVLDLRKEEWVNRDGVIVERRALEGDPLGYIAYDLGSSSEFANHGGRAVTTVRTTMSQRSIIITRVDDTST